MSVKLMGETPMLLYAPGAWGARGARDDGYCPSSNVGWADGRYRGGDGLALRAHGALRVHQLRRLPLRCEQPARRAGALAVDRPLGDHHRLLLVLAPGDVARLPYADHAVRPVARTDPRRKFPHP